MNNRRSFFVQTVFAAAIAAVVIASPARAQYQPAVTPAAPKAAPAPAPDPRVEELQKQLEELKKKSATPAPVPTPTPAPQPTNPNRNLFILAGALLLLVALVVWVLNRRRRNAAEPEEHPETPANEPAAPTVGGTGHGTAHGIIVGLLALGFAAHSLNAASCVVTQIGAHKGDAGEPTLVMGQINLVFCPTDAPAIRVMNGTAPVRVQGLVKAPGGWNFSINPSAPAEYRVTNGTVTIGRLFVTDAPGAWTQHIAVQTARGEIEVVRNGVGTLADRFATLLGNDGKGGTLGTQVQQHETRIAALEQKASPTIDMSAYDKRIASLEAEMDAVRSIATGAQATATKADSKSDLNNDRLNAYGSVVVGTLRRGTIDSKARK